MRKNLIKDADVIAGAVTGALGVYIVMTALNWEVMGPDGPGPGFFPAGYGLGLIFLSLILVFQRAAAVRPAQEAGFDRDGLRRAATTWVAFAGTAALMPMLGFFVSMGLMTIFLGTVVFDRPLKSSILNGVLIALGFYLVFGLALDVALPAGRLGF